MTAEVWPLPDRIRRRPAGDTIDRHPVTNPVHSILELDGTEFHVITANIAPPNHPPPPTLTIVTDTHQHIELVLDFTADRYRDGQIARRRARWTGTHP